MTILSRNSGGGNSSQSQQKFSAPAPSSAIVTSSKNMFDKKVRAPGFKSQESVSSTKTYLTCPKLNKNHLFEYLEVMKGCFVCGLSCHMLRDYPSRQGQGGGNVRAQSKTS